MRATCEWVITFQVLTCVTPSLQHQIRVNIGDLIMSDREPTETHFLGRNDEMLALQQLLAEHVAVTVVGPPGVGKSTLVSHVLGDTPHAWIDVRGSLDDIADTIEELVGVTVNLDEPLSSSIRTVVFDAGEHAVDTVCAWTSWWIRSGAKVLITSRQPIGYEHEVVLNLGPLSIDISRALFMQIAKVNDANAELDELVVALDGLPLAIELAASRTSVMTAQQMATRLDRRFDWLRDIQHQKPSLESVIQASWDALDERSRDVLISLTAFAAEFSLDAAEAVAPEMSGEKAAVNILETLVSRSLVQRIGTSFRLLDSIRTFAKRAGSAAAERAQKKHAAHFIMANLSNRAMFTQMPLKPATCSTELSAVRRRYSRPKSTIYQRATLLWAIAMQTGRMSRSRVISDINSVLKWVDDDDLKRAFWFVRGGFFRDAGHLSQAIEDLNSVVSGLEDWPDLLARSYGEMINIYGALRDIENAEKAAKRAMELFENAEDHHSVALVHLVLGHAAMRVGDVERADSETTKALVHARSFGLPLTAISVNVAGMKLAMGAVERAIDLIDECILDTDQMNARLLCICLTNRGAAHLVLGDLIAAEDDLMQALEINRKIGRVQSDRIASNSLALVWLERGDQEKARTWAFRARGGDIEHPSLGSEPLGVSALAALPDITKANEFLDRARSAIVSQDDTRIVELVESILLGSQLPELPTNAHRLPVFSTLVKFRKFTLSQHVLTVNGVAYDLARRGAMRRVLVRLATAYDDGVPADVYQLFDAGWPGEVAGPEQAANRVYATLSRLRTLGLSDVIRTLDDGYTLSIPLNRDGESTAGA